MIEVQRINRTAFGYAFQLFGPTREVWSKRRECQARFSSDFYATDGIESATGQNVLMLFYFGKDEDALVFRLEMSESDAADF